MRTFKGRRAFFPFLAAVALVALVGCGGGDEGADDDAGGGSSGNGASGSGGASGSAGNGGTSNKGGGGGASGSGGGAASGRILWTVSALIPTLRGIDTGSHEVVFETEIVDITESSVAVNTLAVSDDHVWVARDDGVLTAVDRQTQEIASALDLTPYGESESIDIWHIAAGDGFAITSPEYNIQPPIVRVETSTFDVSSADVLDGVGYPTGILYDGSDVWIMQWNAIELVRLDPVTLEVRDRLALGQNPNDPDAFGDYYGYGFIADSGDTLWVIDTTSIRLLSVDKATLTPRIVDDLSDLTDFEEPLEFDANSRGVFLSLGDQNIIVRFDPQTGERLDTYDLSDRGVGTMAVGEDGLFVTTNDVFVNDVREIDIETGRVVQTIPSEYAVGAIAVQK